MTIKTTLNIHNTILEQIETSSEISGFSNNEIIVCLLKSAIREYSKLYHNGSRRIKYQERDEEKRWKPEHIRFSEAEYEYVNDMKKLYKMSVSNILAYAVRTFLKRVLYEMKRKKTSKNPDNYHFSSYAVVMELIENVICWKFYWGIPQNLALLLPISRQ